MSLPGDVEGALFNQPMEGPGRDALWFWFSLSRASWLTLPRVLMHQMPDDWQSRMAELLNEWDEAWNTDHLPSPFVVARDSDNRFTKWPEWALNYRHPDIGEIQRVRAHLGSDKPEKRGHSGYTDQQRRDANLIGAGVSRELQGNPTNNPKKQGPACG